MKKLTNKKKLLKKTYKKNYKKSLKNLGGGLFEKLKEIRFPIPKFLRSKKPKSNSNDPQTTFTNPMSDINPVDQPNSLKPIQLSNDDISNLKNYLEDSNKLFYFKKSTQNSFYYSWFRKK